MKTGESRQINCHNLFDQLPLSVTVTHESGDKIFVGIAEIMK
jgi:hypothetical protein